MHTRATLMFLASLLILTTVSAYSPLDQWTRRSTNAVNTVRFVGGMFIAVGESGLIMTSSNGMNWVTRAFNQSDEGNYGVAYNGTSFLVVGYGRLLGSLDAITWTNVVLTNQLWGMRFTDVTTDGPRFYVVADNVGGTQPSVLVSPQAPSTNWQSIRVNNAGEPARFSRIIRTASAFIAVGDIYNGIWTSGNGTIWTYRIGRGVEHFTGVAYNGTIALAIGVEGSPYAASSPFTTWTQFSTLSGHPYPYYFGSDVCFADNRFVLDSAFESTNGSNWITHAIGGATSSITYGLGTYVAGGWGGIFQSANIAGTLAVARMASSGPVQVSINIETNRSFVLQAASNNWAWFDLWRSTNFGTNAKYLDWSVTNGTKRFYRTATP
jgi:hypothetical protein